MSRFHYYVQHIRERLGRTDAGSVFCFGRNGQMESSKLINSSEAYLLIVEIAFVRGTAMNSYAGESDVTFSLGSGYALPLNASQGAETLHRRQMEEHPRNRPLGCL